MANADPATWDGTIVQYGKMHDTIARQQHQARVSLMSLVERQHFFGVAALAGLSGEATINDGQVVATMVDANGRLQPSDEPASEQATLLIGAYVPSWSRHTTSRDVGPQEFDQFLAERADAAGIGPSPPFPFVIEGEFRDLRLHVINGVCPLHARLKKLEILAANKPFEAALKKVRGTIVGLYARDAVGNITHPGTSTHAHLIFADQSGKLVTGHLEQVGLLQGAVVRFPKIEAAKTPGD